MMKKLVTLLVMAFAFSHAIAQTTPSTVVPPVEPALAVEAPPVVKPSSGMFSVDADFRTRLEVGDSDYPGRRLILEGENLESQIRQRARININYKTDAFELMFSPQSFRTWGAGASADADAASLALADVWFKYNIDENAYIKIGRQALSYDDQRLLGALDWALQGRFFDAALYSRKLGENSKIDVAVTLNSNGKDNGSEIKTPDGVERIDVVDFAERTKSMQMIHFTSKVSDKFKFTAIALNNVLDGFVGGNFDGTTYNMTTLGVNPHLTLSEKVSLFGSAYYQTGKNTAAASKNAYQASANIKFVPSSSASFILGGEILSGDENGNSDGENKAFSPLYGTNHAHNGYIDFFYVGNHANTVGLVDGYLKTQYKLSEKSTFKANVHYFSAAADVDEKDFGAELDLVFVRNVSKGFNFLIGHSQFFAQDGLYAAKGITSDQASDYQGWSWVQLNFKPNLFKTTL